MSLYRNSAGPDIDYLLREINDRDCRIVELAHTVWLEEEARQKAEASLAKLSDKERPNWGLRAVILGLLAVFGLGLYELYQEGQSRKERAVSLDKKASTQVKAWATIVGLTDLDWVCHSAADSYYWCMIYTPAGKPSRIRCSDRGCFCLEDCNLPQVAR